MKYSQAITKSKEDARMKAHGHCAIRLSEVGRVLSLVSAGRYFLSDPLILEFAADHTDVTHLEQSCKSWGDKKRGRHTVGSSL